MSHNLRVEGEKEKKHEQLVKAGRKRNVDGGGGGGGNSCRIMGEKEKKQTKNTDHSFEIS